MRKTRSKWTADGPDENMGPCFKNAQNKNKLLQFAHLAK